MTVMPGFIDAHVHLAFPDPDAPVADEVLEAGAAERAAAALAGGVTTVRDLGSADGIALELRDAVRAGRIPGPRILAAGAPITTTRGHCHWFGEHADTGEELVAAVERLAASRRRLRQDHGDGRDGDALEQPVPGPVHPGAA